jgi:uncharacterized membrane-anchored protein
MRKCTLLLLSILLIACEVFAKNEKDSLALEMEWQTKLVDSIEHSLKWETTPVTIGDGIARLKLKKGFKFLNAEQSRYVLHDLWGNPPREDVLGMIFPEEGGPFADSSFAFIVSYEATGFVKDDDAEDIDYDDMLKEIQKSEPEVNKTRQEEGYEPIHMAGWAAKPFYDKDRKVLHWAKELQFGGEDYNTLNYDIRVLGRKGVLSLNAIATMDELPLVKANIDDVLEIPEFTAGNQYADFNSKTDKVAEYGIGAIVAGTVLAKTGALAAIGKFLVAAGKFIVLGIVALFGAIKKFFTGRKKGDDNMQETMAA